MRDWDDPAPSTSNAAYNNHAFDVEDEDDNSSPASDLAAIARDGRQDAYCRTFAGAPLPPPSPHREQHGSSSAMPLPPPLPPPSKKNNKAKGHRKRHVPVGPAGVWFQANHHHPRGGGAGGTGGGGAGTRRRHHHQPHRRQDRGGGGEDDDAAAAADHDRCLVGGPTEEEALGDEELVGLRSRPMTYYGGADHDGTMGESMTQGSGEDTNKSSATTAGGGLSLCSPAWMCMQCDLGLVLPAIPPNVPMSVAERSSSLRQCLPPHYRLLPDLVRRDGTHWRHQDRKVLVLVQAVQTLTDTLWTVKVTDETLSSFTAWIQPALVRQEQQRPQPKYVRPGFVWLLAHPTTILVGGDGHNHLDNDACDDSSNDDSNRHHVERMLLVSEETIERVWAPSQAKSVPDDTFVAWLERRNVVTASVMEAWEGRRSVLSPTQPNRPSHSHSHPSNSNRPSRRPSFDDEDVEDRAPLDSVHESDEEEFTLQLSQPPRINPMVAAPFPMQAQPCQRSAQQDRLLPSVARGSAVPAPDARASRNHSVGFATAVPTPPPHHNEYRGGTRLDSRPATIPPSNLSPPANCNDGRGSGRSTNGSTCQPIANTHVRATTGDLRPPVTNPLGPQEPARSPRCSNGRGTFGFSQFLSQPITDPPSRPNLAENVDRTSSSHAVEAGACSTPPPPPAENQRRDSAGVSSKSRKKRKKRSTSVGKEKSPTNHNNSTPRRVPSVLWSYHAGCSSLLGMFDDDSDDGDVESLFPSRKPKAASSVGPAEVLRSIETGDQRIETPPRPSLFDNIIGLTVNDLFSDDEG